jgi:hypothetical protein
MLIGKFWDSVNQKYLWAEGQDFEELTQTLKNEIADYGGNDEIDPAKIEVYKAVKMKVVATYEIQAGD